MTDIIRICSYCEKELVGDGETTDRTQDQIIKEHEELQAFFHKEIELRLSHGVCSRDLAILLAELNESDGETNSDKNTVKGAERNAGKEGSKQQRPED